MEMMENTADPENIYMNEEETENTSNPSGIYDEIYPNTTTQNPGSAGVCGRRTVVKVADAAVVGLGFLCVLLLAVIVVLCIKHNAELHQIQSDNQNVTADKDSLQSRYEILNMDKDQLQSRYEILNMDKDQLQSRYEILNMDKDQLQSRYEILNMDKDQLQSRYEILNMDKDQLQSRYEILNMENNQVQRYYNILITEKDQLQRSFNTLRSESKALQRRLTETGFCPYQWTKFMSSCYLILSERKSWEESRQDCRSLGVDLVIINSKEEQQFVSGLGANFWIGLSDRDHEGHWKWVDNTALQTGYWMSMEPNNGGHPGSDEDCAEVVSPTGFFSSISTWNDGVCSSTLPPLCEKKLQCNTQ